MKKLIFIRHSKAEEPSPEISDFERSLTLKGKSISRMMAMRLREVENSPGIMISSPAFRALETAYIFAEEFGTAFEKIIILSTLYYKMNINYLPEVLSKASEYADTIILFGHNPSFTEIADSLCREGCGFIPKCGVAGISFNIKTWPEIKHNTGKLEYFLKPEKTV
jgi:phosphohistidine phosphatase